MAQIFWIVFNFLKKNKQSKKQTKNNASGFFAGGKMDFALK